MRFRFSDGAELEVTRFREDGQPFCPKCGGEDLYGLGTNPLLIDECNDCGDVKIVPTVDVAWVSGRIAEIEQSDDPEEAHSLEDAVFVAVLTEIARGGKDPSELAKEALRSCAIKFARWCA